MSNPQIGDPNAVQKAAAPSDAETLAVAKVAADVKLADAKVAAELKLADAKIAARKEVTDFYRTVVMPVVLAALVAIPGIISAWRIGDTHKLVNSRMDQLVVEVKKTARAEGVKEGKEDKSEHDGAKLDFGQRLLEAARQQRVMAAK